MNRYFLKAQRAMTNLRRADTRRDPRRARYWCYQCIRYCILGLRRSASELHVNCADWTTGKQKTGGFTTAFTAWEQVEPCPTCYGTGKSRTTCVRCGKETNGMPFHTCAVPNPKP